MEIVAGMQSLHRPPAQRCTAMGARPSDGRVRSFVLSGGKVARPKGLELSARVPRASWIRKRRRLFVTYPGRQIDRISNQVAGHSRHLAHEFVHGRNLSRLAVSLRRLSNSLRTSNFRSFAQILSGSCLKIPRVGRLTTALPGLKIKNMVPLFGIFFGRLVQGRERPRERH